MHPARAGRKTSRNLTQHRLLLRIMLCHRPKKRWRSLPRLTAPSEEQTPGGVGPCRMAPSHLSVLSAQIYNGAYLVSVQNCSKFKRLCCPDRSSDG